jgi:branched-subunit amino acid transport protein
MTSVWLAVGLVGAATIAIKASGPVLLGERDLPVVFGRVVDLLAPALLAALVATQTFAGDRELVVDERAAGLAAAGAVVALRAPILAAAVAAAVTTALLRAI